MLKNDLAACHRAISPNIYHTPTLSSSFINKEAGAEIVFKCENFQKTGSFKIRGASNALRKLSQEQKRRGVIAHSSGNFAQALAHASANHGVKCYIIMPSTAAHVKREATIGYGARLVQCEATMESREATTRRIVEESGATFIHPSDNMDVIMGQSTAARELLGDHPDLDLIITPVGGGGLIAGTALAAKAFGNNCRVVGGEPEEADDAYRSMLSGKIETNTTTNTIAEGLLTHLGENNFPIIQAHVDEIIRVSEAEIIAAMKLIWSRMKIIVEPSSSVALAALLKKKEQFSSKRIGIILSGGNVDLEHLPF